MFISKGPFVIKNKSPSPNLIKIMSTTSDSSNSDSSDSHTTTTDQDNHCISWKNKKFISYKLKSRAPSTALWNEDQKAEWDELKGFAENLKTKVTISEEYSIDSSRTNRRKSISKTKFPEVDDRKEEHLLNLDYNPNSFQNTRYGDTHDADAAINQECNLSPGYTRQQRNKVPTNSSKRYDQRMYSKLNSPDPPPRRQNQYSRSRNESSRNDDLEEKWFKDIEDEVCQKYGITLPEDLYLQLPQGQQQIKLFRQQPRTSSSLHIDSELIKTYVNILHDFYFTNYCIHSV